MYILRPLILGHTVLLSLFLVSCNARPSYYITAPSYIMPGVNISLAVHWFGNYSEITVTAGFMDKGRILVNASKLFYNDSIGMLTLPGIPAVSASNYYTLGMIGCAYNTLVFSEYIPLYMKTKDISIFIQTEKTMYKPGESVKIRVISVNQDLMPYKGNVNLVIKDPKGNIIQQWLNMKSDLGVVSIEFLLSNSPLLGDWIIQVTSGDYVYSVNFSVAEFASPGFDVTLDVPSFYINSKTDDLIGTVTAKASSVKPIIGSVIISVKPLYDFGVNTEVNKTYQLSSGSVNFSFTYEEIQNELYREAINVTASVTEELTGIVVNASSNVTRAYSEYRINLIRKQLAFAPGLNFTAKFQVQRMDQNPLSKRERDEKVSVTITQVLNGEQTDITMQQIIIPESAILNIEFPVLKSVRWVSMNVVYRNVSEMFYSDDVYTMNPFIEIQIPESSLKVGKPFEVRVNTYLELREIYYMVISKGTVVSVGKNSTTFSLTPEQSWAPSAQLIVYMLSINQTYKGIMQISKTLSIKGIFNNKVSLSWSKNTAQPTEQVSLSVNVKESGSLVGLRVVDKSSTRLGDGNDLTASRVYRELNSYYQGITTSLTDGAIYNKDDLLPRIHNSERIELPSRQVIPVLSENWIWLEINISSSLTRTLQVVVPDRNTSWVATAFVISEGLGLGVIDEPVEISVFKPFLLSFNMPYSVTRGEQFILEVILSSSLAQNLQVLVTLEPSDSFEIIVPNNNNTGTVAGQQNVTVASQGGTTVLYPIKPRKLGNITITVKATSNAASDVLTKTIIVKAEGVKYFYSQTTLFTNANANQTLSKNFSFTFPNDVVQGSEEAFVTVIGDLLGPSINGLESLIQMPYGCGEQNMINLAPNIYILQYLTAVNQLKEDMRKQAINFMEQGYQKELTYKRDDGSFSAFGNSDPSGSTWLSAFVFRCFLQARPFIYINPDVLRVTVEWMVQYQDMNTGVFSEPGCVIHHELQGGLNGPITLTAYILTSLLEDEYYRHLYEPRVVKAVQYLESEFEVGISSNYTLSVVVYALSLANSTKAEVALTQLNSRASITGGTKYWSSSSETSSYYWQPRTTDIETAAYALLSYYKQNRIVEGIPVMKWLSEQRSHLGGHGSTQDTIMALKALSQFMLVAPSSQTSLTVSVTGSSPFVPKTFQINSGNLLVLQSQQIEISQPLLFTATAVGRGLAIFQFNIMYNRKSSPRRRRTTPLSEAFKLDVTVKEDKSNIHKLSVDVCMRYQGMGNESGMALLDVGFLSGFTLKPEGIPKTQSLKLVEPKEDKVYIYLDSLTKDELCVSVPMVRFAKVAGAQDAVVKVCDYYNPEKAATRTYNSLTMSSISSCDFCGVNCNQCKSNVPVKPQKSSATAPTFSILWFSMIFIGYLL